MNDFTRDQSFEDAALVLSQFGEPDQPFAVLRGDAGDSICLDVGLVRRIHAQAPPDVGEG